MNWNYWFAVVQVELSEVLGPGSTSQHKQDVAASHLLLANDSSHSPSGGCGAEVEIHAAATGVPQIGAPLWDFLEAALAGNNAESLGQMLGPVRCRVWQVCDGFQLSPIKDAWLAGYSSWLTACTADKTSTSLNYLTRETVDELMCRSEKIAVNICGRATGNVDTEAANAHSSASRISGVGWSSAAATSMSSAVSARFG